MPIIVYKDIKQLLELSISIVDGLKRNVLETLSPAALPSNIVAEQLGLPTEMIQECLRQLVELGLVIKLGKDKSGQKYYTAVSPILRDIDIKELKPGFKKLADNFCNEFLDNISQNHAILEKIFAGYNGQYTLGRIVEYACSNVIELMYKKIQTEVIEENKRIISEITPAP